MPAYIQIDGKGKEKEMKKIIAILLVLTLAVGMAACRNKESVEKTDSEYVKAQGVLLV